MRCYRTWLIKASNKSVNNLWNWEGAVKKQKNDAVVTQMVKLYWLDLFVYDTWHDVCWGYKFYFIDLLTMLSIRVAKKDVYTVDWTKTCE